jgi:hypothetical protein
MCAFHIVSSPFSADPTSAADMAMKMLEEENEAALVALSRSPPNIFAKFSSSLTLKEFDTAQSSFVQWQE